MESPRFLSTHDEGKGLSSLTYRDQRKVIMDKGLTDPPIRILVRSLLRPPVPGSRFRFPTYIGTRNRVESSAVSPNDAVHHTDSGVQSSSITATASSSKSVHTLSFQQVAGCPRSRDPHEGRQTSGGPGAARLLAGSSCLRSRVNPLPHDLHREPDVTGLAVILGVVLPDR